jgi:hypothetical protein
MKIRPVGAGLLNAETRTDRQTDITTAVVAFRKFANAPTKRSSRQRLLLPLLRCRLTSVPLLLATKKVIGADFIYLKVSIF